MIHVDPAHPAFEQLPRDQQARILYFNVGWSVAALADEYGVNKRAVQRWLDKSFRDADNERRLREHHETKREPVYERDYSDVYGLFTDGMTPMEIIAALGLPRATVYRVLKEKYGSMRTARKQREAA